MKQVIDEVNIEKQDLKSLISDIAESHIPFERIHPFLDGNDRTGRIILNQQLINNDLLPITIDKTSKYRQAFQIYEKNKDISLWIPLFFRYVFDLQKTVHYNTSIDNYTRIGRLYGREVIISGYR